MRFALAALVALFVFAPAAQAQVTFTGVPPSPTRQFTFDVGFSAPGAVRYDCVHVFPDSTSSEQLDCHSPFEFRELEDGRHELRVTATDTDGVKTEGSVFVVVDTLEPPAPVIASPAENALVGTTVMISGTTTAETTVAVYDGATNLGPAVVDADNTWTFEAKDLAQGPHAFTAIATDTAGNPSPASAERHVTVDTVAPAAPTVSVPVEGFIGRERRIALSGVTEAASTVAVYDGETKLGEVAAPEGNWAFTTDDLAEGAHTLRAIATDRAGNASPETARHVTIDTVAPGPVEPTQTGTSQFAFAGEAGATFECSVDGGDFAPCTSPQQLSGLGAGEHRFSVRAVDAAGNRSAPTAKAFSIAPEPVVTPAATPGAPPPAPTPAPPVAAAAELGRTLVARTVSGKVYVRRPATAASLDLGTVAGIPVGTEIDARKGRVRLTAAATRGRAAHRAEFFGGVFVVGQSADDIVDLQLSEPFGSCAKKTGTRLRKLWGDGTGRFRMRGLNAVVTVRGTRWLVQDSCEGTLTRVSQGLVSVRDTVKRRTVLVRAGRKYLAVPKKRG